MSYHDTRLKISIQGFGYCVWYCGGQVPWVLTSKSRYTGSGEQRFDTREEAIAHVEAHCRHFAKKIEEARKFAGLPVCVNRARLDELANELAAEVRSQIGCGLADRSSSSEYFLSDLEYFRRCSDSGKLLGLYEALICHHAELWVRGSYERTLAGGGSEGNGWLPRDDQPRRLYDIAAAYCVAADGRLPDRPVATYNPLEATVLPSDFLIACQELGVAVGEYPEVPWFPCRREIAQDWNGVRRSNGTMSWCDLVIDTPGGRKQLKRCVERGAEVWFAWQGQGPYGGGEDIEGVTAQAVLHHAWKQSGAKYVQIGSQRWELSTVSEQTLREMVQARVDKAALERRAARF